MDEGGIVKVSGDYLVVLRRGRLFTVSTANGALTPVDRIDVIPPGMDTSDAWYDEMLIHGRTIVVLGYSYEMDATELSRFALSADGRLSHVDTHHLRSDDYYSARNYATRIVGDTLILYTPLETCCSRGDPLDLLPGLSRWQPGQSEPVFTRLASGRDVHVPGDRKAEGLAWADTLHSVTRCDLSAAALDCRSSVVLGPQGRNFHVAQDAVFVWVAPRWRRGEAAYVYRLPLDGSAPQAARVRGAPLDQFSFSYDAAAGVLNVLVLPEGGGDAMWSSRFAAGQPALLRLPLQRFGDGSAGIVEDDYRPLPGGEDSWLLRNRFVGDWLVYATEHDNVDGNELVGVPVHGGDALVFPLDAPVSRIEAMGRDALVVTDSDDLDFLTLDLGGAEPVLSDRLTLGRLGEAEERSHAFFYRPDLSAPDGRSGLIGLPVMTWNDLGDEGADMLFARRTDGVLERYGRLQSNGGADRDDDCRASCVDWYGNARPIFLGDRILALLGYELVEGVAGDKRVEEAGRIDLAPPPRPARPAVPAPGGD